MDNFPIPLLNEKDLEIYDKYITEVSVKNLPEYLKNHIGKPAKVEVAVLNRIETKVGILMDVGKDFLVLKLPECQSLIIEGGCIKFITVMHNGNYRKFGK